MIDTIGPLGGAFLGLFRIHRSLLLENLPRRQQLEALKRRHPMPKLPSFDKLFWVLARTFWSGWKQVLIVVSPETVERPTRIKQHHTILIDGLRRSSRNLSTLVGLRPQSPVLPRKPTLDMLRRHKSELGTLSLCCRIALWRTTGLKEFPHRRRSGGSPGKCLDAQAFQRQAKKALMLIEGGGLIVDEGKR